MLYLNGFCGGGEEKSLEKNLGLGLQHPYKLQFLRMLICSKKKF